MNVCLITGMTEDEQDWLEWDKQIEWAMERLGREEWKKRLRGKSSMDFMGEEYR